MWLSLLQLVLTAISAVAGIVAIRDLWTQRGKD